MSASAHRFTIMKVHHRRLSCFRGVFILLLVALFLCCHADRRINDLRACIGIGSMPVYTPGNFNYNRLRHFSFKSNYQKPLAMVEAFNEWQVTRFVKCARESAIRVCARSGGHSLTGHSQCRGLVIDLAHMRSVVMEPGHIARIQPGATLGEVLWQLRSMGRWLAGGVCPSVGFAGYVLGGGHGPYEGRLGLACDSMISLRMVDRFGEVLEVSKNNRASLFQAMCGAGGGQFGIVTSFRFKTVSSAPFDRGVVFRFNWPVEVGGEVLEKWQDYGEFGGNVWFRMEVYLAKRGEKGVYGYGACYDVSSVDACMKRLSQAKFFNTPGRRTIHMSQTYNALALHAFFGPEGGWGRKRVYNLYPAFMLQRGKEGSAANTRKYKSTFLKMSRKKKPSKQFWQQYVEFCQLPKKAKSIPWVVCEMNLFNNRIDRKQKNAFAFRSANIITHYIIGGGSAKDKIYAYNWMKNHLKRFTMGVYINYPELELKKNEYAKAYWGNQLSKLRKVKRIYDPEDFFMNPQPIP